MKIDIYESTGHSFAPTTRGIELAEAITPDLPEYAEALHDLEKDGRAWIGGGAAPRVLLMRAAA